MPPKYLITSAGLGSRLGAYSKHKNKALITLGTKPAISHIIDKIPFDAEIVLALGYKGDLLRSAISAFHPDRKISFQTIDNYEGVGTGGTFYKGETETINKFLKKVGKKIIKFPFYNRPSYIIK